MQTKFNDIAVFTHGKFARSFAFFISGFAVFFYVRQFITVKSIWENLTAKSLIYPQSEHFYLLMKLLAGLSLVAGFIIVCVVFYTLIDVWGLKVIITEQSLVVINTLVKHFPGTGEIPCEEIIEIKKGMFRFKIVGEKNSVSISGVERIELLFHLIHECRKKRFKMAKKHKSSHL